MIGKSGGEMRADELLRDALGLAPEQEPFPWQQELLRRFLRGDIVEALDIPTGLGKTATMAIWLVARALGAALPRRLVYVVDRRAVVDQATEVAEGLRTWVQGDRAIAGALGLGDRPLPISTLRGQYVDNREWLDDPSAPAIVVGTVDMIGSRLLFSGYGVSAKMRPYHAGLLGVDALIVLDEAHLVPPFEALLRRIESSADALGPKGPTLGALIPKFSLLSLSATGRQLGAVALTLSDEDRRDPIACKRLEAVKRLRVAEPVEAEALAEELAARAWKLTSGGAIASRVIVFVDSRKTAQAVDEALRGRAKRNETGQPCDIETALFVGGRRVAEREGAAAKLKALGVIAGSSATAAKPVFVIATSAGEVGVDLDADHAVLDLVEWERMVQRLGRVNRRGMGDAEIWIIPTLPDKKTIEGLEKEAKLQKKSSGSSHESNEEDEGDGEEDDKAPKKLKEDERARVDRWKRREATLRAIRCLSSAGGAFDASPRALAACREAQGALIEEASTPAPLYPALDRAVVESWSMTSLPQHTGRPEVRPWLRGWLEEEAQTSVVWRTWLPRKADAEAFFEAAPVERAEVLETESALALDWLGKRVKAVLKARENVLGAARTEERAADDDDAVMFVLGDDLRGWTLRELDQLDRKELLRSISGETIVLSARLGGLGDGLLDPKSDVATDVSEARPLSFRVREVSGDLDAFARDDNWRVEGTFASKANDEGETLAWLVVETDKGQQSTTADGRSTGGEQKLSEHQASVERHVRQLADRLALAPEYANLLALAAVLHDEGKKAERWQRAFRVPQDKRPLGKATSRPIQSILAGYRHELGALPDAERDPRVAGLSPEDRDLVLHLIAAHHGFARPLLRTNGCESAPPSALVECARAIALRFARLEQRWGPWGLAWWEALLRAADQRASRENDARGGEHG